MVANLVNDGVMDVWYCERFFYVLLLSAALCPVVLKKELAELEWLSWVLFASIGLFVVINIWQLEFDPQFNSIGFDNCFKPNKGFARFVSAVSVTMVAYSYQCNLWPIYSSLAVKTNEKFMTVNNYGVLLTSFIYIGVAIISIGMFGQDILPVVLSDIGQATKANGKAFWESYIT